MAADPARLSLRHRQDRQLHHVRPGNGPVEQWQGGRIDHVFRVVQYDHTRTMPLPRLVNLQRAIEAIQAIGLGGRPVPIMHDDAQPPIAARRRTDRRQRGEIVGIAAHVKAQAILPPDAQQVPDRSSDDSSLAPGRDEHRRLTFQCRSVGKIIRNRPIARAARQTQPQPDKVDHEFVESTNEEENRSKKKQFVLHQHEPFERRELA